MNNLTWHDCVPSSQRLVGEELRGIHRDKRHVWFELRDLSWNYAMLESTSNLREVTDALNELR